MGLRVLALAILASTVLVNAQAAPAAWVVRVQPGQVVNGSPVLFSVKPSKPLASLTANWLGNQVPFVLNPKDKTWYGLGGVALKTKPGTYTLKLVGTSGPGAETVFEKHFSIGKGKYRKIAIKVSKRFTEPNPEQVRKITEDKATKQEAFSKSSADANGRGILPLRWTRRIPTCSEPSGRSTDGCRARIKASTTRLELVRRSPPSTPAQCCWRGLCILKATAWYLITARDCKRSTCIFPKLQ